MFSGLIHRGKLDNNPDLIKYAETVEKVIVDSIESGIVTKDLAGCIHGTFTGLEVGRDFYTTDDFMGALDENIQKALA